MGENGINEFLSHLTVNKHLSSSTQNQALCAIVFLYKRIVRKEIGNFGKIIWLKKPKRLPVVLTKEEVKII